MNIEVIIPIINVTAKPLIGPDPKLNRIKAAINVVKFALTIVLIALEYPESIAEIGVLPPRTSSLILSKTRTLGK